MSHGSPSVGCSIKLIANGSSPLGAFVRTKRRAFLCSTQQTPRSPSIYYNAKSRLLRHAGVSFSHQRRFAATDIVGRDVGLPDRLQGDAHRVGAMLQRCAGRHVDNTANDAAKDDVARESGSALAAQPRDDRHGFGVVAPHVHCDGELILAAELQRAGRDAGMPHRRARLGARRARVDLYLNVGAARDRRAASHGEAKPRGNKPSFHRHPPSRFYQRTTTTGGC